MGSTNNSPGDSVEGIPMIRITVPFSLCSKLIEDTGKFTSLLGNDIDLESVMGYYDISGCWGEKFKVNRVVFEILRIECSRDFVS